MKKLLTACLLTTALCGATFAETIWTETFETDGNGTRYTTTTPEFSNGDEDFYTRTDGSNIGGAIDVGTPEGSYWFGMMDVDAEGALAAQTITFTNFSITGKSSLIFKVLLSEDDDGTNEDWDGSDYAHFQYKIDSGDWQELLWVEASSDGSNFEPAIDTDQDGTGDSPAITDAFTEFSASITGTGNVLAIRCATSFNSGDEDIAMDNLRVEGTSAGSTFDFLNDADLYGALSGETGPITFTNNGLAATFSTSAGSSMNGTASGFGIDDNLLPFEDPDGFDVGEAIDITFDTEVKLTNVVVSNWEANDQATIKVDGVSQGVITSAGGHPFDIFISTGQVLRIECADISAGADGWSLDSISVLPYTPFPPVFEAIGDKKLIVSNSLSFAVTATDENNEDIVLSVSNLPPGAVFNTVTNAGSVSNTFTWNAAAPAGVYTPTFTADDGITKVSETVTITVIEPPVLMISEVADPNGTGGGLYRFVELWNAGTNTIDLAADNWTLSMQDNGDPGDWRDVALTGSIGPTGVYVVANIASNFTAAYGFAPDLADEEVVDGNGRDSYALYFGGDHTSGTLIDIYGEIDVDGDGAAWDYENDRAERNDPVLKPNTTWTASEWTLTVNAETNEFSPGIHGPEPAFSPIPEDQLVELGDDLSLVVTATNTVIEDVITLSAIDLPGTATFPTVIGTNGVSSTLSWIAPTAGTYSVTFAAKGVVDTTTATIEILVVDLAADNDGDGVSNGDELIAGTDIESEFSFFRITSSELGGSGNTINWFAVDGRRYIVLWTPSLLEAFEPQVTNDAPVNSWTDTVHTAESNGFYQLEVQLIP